MKLKTFNTENTKTVRLGSPAIGVNTKAGLFTFNKLAAELMGLGHGDLIVIHQDEDDKVNFYMEKVKSAGFKVKEKKNGNGELTFNNTALARQLQEELECIEKSYRLLIAKDPTKHEKRLLWALLLSGR